MVNAFYHFYNLGGGIFEEARLCSISYMKDPGTTIHDKIKIHFAFIDEYTPEFSVAFKNY